MTYHLKVSGTEPRSYEVWLGSKRRIVQANRFLRGLALRGLSDYTVRSYGYDLVSLHRWMKSSRKSIKNLKEPDLFSLIENCKKRNLGPAAINRQLTVVRVFYRFLFDRDMPSGKRASTGNPYYRGRGRDYAAGIFVLRKKSNLKLQIKMPFTLVRPLTRDEANQMIRSFEQYRDIAITLLMLLGGLRSCEIRTLNLEDVNFINKRILVRGKGKKERTIPLADSVGESIRKYIDLERPTGHFFENLFVCLKGKRRGNPMTAAGLRSVFRYHRKTAGVHAANPHRFRHTFGVNLAKARVNHSALQTLLGHELGSRVTLRYTQLTMADVSDAYHEAMQRIEKPYESVGRS